MCCRRKIAYTLGPMATKIRVGVLFGGKSAEHEVSLQSARNILEAIDKEKYDVVLVGIDRDGRWLLNEGAALLLPEGTGESLMPEEGERGAPVTLIPEGRGQLVRSSGLQPMGVLDVVFPVLHGPMGEDGTVQGLLKLADVPFVGADVLGSAVGMDKDVMKRLLRDAGVPSPRFLVCDRRGAAEIDFDAVRHELGSPVFVKPANMGSSVGVSKASDQAGLASALAEALRYDHKVLIEELIAGREIECAVLGNEAPIASVPGEVLPKHDFYSYEAKYVDEEGATLEIPAKLPEATVRAVQEMAIRAFQVLCCEGMARVDFFLLEDGRPLVNEINSIPGFTKISMYPMLWEASGISYTELIDRLIQLAIERHRRTRELETSYQPGTALGDA